MTLEIASILILEFSLSMYDLWDLVSKILQLSFNEWVNEGKLNFLRDQRFPSLIEW